jgi:hypothetical protein
MAFGAARLQNAMNACGNCVTPGIRCSLPNVSAISLLERDVSEVLMGGELVTQNTAINCSMKRHFVYFY